MRSLMVLAAVVLLVAGVAYAAGTWTGSGYWVTFYDGQPFAGPITSGWVQKR